MKTPAIEDLYNNPNLGLAHSIKKRYPEFYEYLLNKYPKDLTFSERLYWYYHNWNGYKQLCPVCGCPSKFHNFRKGYNKYCSIKCSNKDEDKKLKTKETCVERYGGVGYASPIISNAAKETCLEKYGSKNPRENEEINNKIKETCIKRYGTTSPLGSKKVWDKIKQTNLEKYGVEYNINSSQIQEKIKKTNLERYGAVNPLNNLEVREKFKKTNLERYGVEYPFQSNTVQESGKKTRILKYGTDHVLDLQEFKDKAIASRNKSTIDSYPIIQRILKNNDEYIYECSCPHPDCKICTDKKFNIPAAKFYVRKYDGRELCTKLCKESPRESSLEYKICEHLDSLNINYIRNNREILSGKEIDIYIPSYKLGIECNGCYWHSIKYKTQDYHIKKFKECCNCGVTLLTFWEDQIYHKFNIVKSIIDSKLGNNIKIYARCCEVVEVSPEDANNFLQDNHLQGPVRSKIKIGLRYNGQLVSLMTFGQKRISLGNKASSGWELYRFCNKIGISVVGGASKMLKHFIKTYTPEYIESFSSNDISFGDLYKTLGFEQIGESKSYWYVDSKNFKRYHRFNFTKKSLVESGFDSAKSESDIMLDRGFYKIYDSGQTKWLLKCAK